MPWLNSKGTHSKKKKKDSVEYNKDSEKDRAGKAAKKYLLSGIDRERS